MKKINQSARSAFKPNFSSLPSPAKKPVVIGAITVVILLVLVIFFFGTKQFAGKAVYTAPDTDTFAVGSAGIIDTPEIRNIDRVDFLVVEVGADIGTAASVAFEFEMNYPSDYFSFEGVVPRVDWSGETEEDVAFSRTTPGSDSFLFEYATLDYSSSITGEVFLADVRFRIIDEIVPYQSRLGEITFNDISVWNLDAPEDDLITGQPVTVASVEPVAGVTECTADAALCGQFCTDNQVCPPVDDSLPAEEPTELNQDTVTAFCQQDANSATCQNMCTTLGLCPTAAGTYTVDINGDNTINGQDAFIILKIAEALVRPACGENAQVPCGPFSGTYTCDSGNFRVQDYKGFTFAAGTLCSSFSGTAEYVRGS